MGQANSTFSEKYSIPPLTEELTDCHAASMNMVPHLNFAAELGCLAYASALVLRLVQFWVERRANPVSHGLSWMSSKATASFVSFMAVSIIPGIVLAPLTSAHFHDDVGAYSVKLDDTASGRSHYYSYVVISVSCYTLFFVILSECFPIAIMRKKEFFYFVSSSWFCSAVVVMLGSKVLLNDGFSVVLDLSAALKFSKSFGLFVGVEIVQLLNAILVIMDAAVLVAKVTFSMKLAICVANKAADEVSVQPAREAQDAGPETEAAPEAPELAAPPANGPTPERATSQQQLHAGVSS